MKYLIKLKGEQLKLVKTLSVFFVLFLNTTIVNASDKFCDTKFDELLFKGLTPILVLLYQKN